MKRLFSLVLFILGTAGLVACTAHPTEQQMGVTILGSGGYYESPVWAPDGMSIAVAHSDENGKTQIEVLDNRGKQIYAVPRTSGILTSPGWKGTQVLFLESAASPVYLRLSTVSDVETLADVSGTALASWSQDGRWGVLLQGGDGGPSRLRLLDTSTLKSRVLGFDKAPFRFRLSPSGRFLAFVRQDSTGGTLAVQDLESGDVQDLWHVPYSEAVLGDITWAPNEKWVGVRRGRGEKNNGFYVLPRQGSAEPRLLTPIDMVSPDWSPDGKHIVYTTVGSPGANELRLLTVDIELLKVLAGN